MTAPALAELQRWYQAALTAPAGTDARLPALLSVPDGSHSADRLAIYQRSYRQRLVQCLGEQFPALRHALGARLFADFAADYLGACPSRSYTLYALGDRFAAFLEASRPDRDLPEQSREVWIDFMVDLARFEHAVFELFDAEGSEGLRLATAATPPEHLRLQPAMRLMTARFAVPPYYEAVKLARKPDLPPPQRSHIAMVRKDFRIRTMMLAEWQYALLKAMRDGAGIADAVARCAAEHGLDPDRLREALIAGGGPLERWIGLGFFLESA